MAPRGGTPAIHNQVEAEQAARLRLCLMRLARRLRSQAEGDVSASQLSALSSLGCQGELTLGELSAIERVKPPTMTKVVAALEELGFVARTADPADRRVARVAPTAAGLKFLDQSRRRKDAYLADRLRSLSDEERETLARATDVLERLLDGP